MNRKEFEITLRLYGWEKVAPTHPQHADTLIAEYIKDNWIIKRSRAKNMMYLYDTNKTYDVNARIHYTREFHVMLDRIRNIGEKENVRNT